MRSHPSSKEGEQRVKELHKGCPKLFEFSREAIYITSREGEYVDANESFLDLFGYTREDLMSLTEQELYADPGDGARIQQAIEKGAAQDIQVMLRKKDGTELDCLLTASAWLAEDGSILGYRGIIRDAGSQEMRRSYELMVNTSKHLMTLINREYRYEAVNDAYCLAHGKSRTDIIGKTVADLWGEGLFQQIIRPHLDPCFAGDEVHYESWFAFNVREPKRCYEVSCFPHYGDGEEVTHAVAISRDVTERKEVEEEQRRIEAQLDYSRKIETLGTLAGGIAHSFNNLLMGILGNVSLTLLDTDPAHPHYERLKSVEACVEKGSNLTKQLLAYAREGKYEDRPLRLNQLINEALDTFGTTRREIRIHMDLAGDLSEIKGDSEQMVHALLNLYVNAADAMPAGGALFLKTANVTHEDMAGRPYTPEPGSYVLLTVRDTGGGMDKETMERIFEPFFTTKGLAKATGLGLSSVYGIVKAHGGYIDIASEEAAGTTFTIYLPALEKGVEKPSESSDPIIEGSGTILLVDDEAMVLDVGGKMVNKLGYMVLTAKGGKEAIDLYQATKDKIDMVILDMIMPDMGGGDTYDRMKEINPEIKVLLSSGYTIDGQAKQMLERGCNGFIQKPFTMKELSKKIRETLDPTASSQRVSVVES